MRIFGVVWMSLLVGCMLPVPSKPKAEPVATIGKHVELQEKGPWKKSNFPRDRVIGTETAEDATSVGSTLETGIYTLGFAGSDAQGICFSRRYDFDSIDAPPEKVIERFDDAMKDSPFWYMAVSSLEEVSKMPVWPRPAAAAPLNVTKIIDDKVIDVNKKVQLGSGGTATMPVKIRKITMGMCTGGTIPPTARFLLVLNHSNEKERGDKYGDALYVFELK